MWSWIFVRNYFIFYTEDDVLKCKEHNILSFAYFFVFNTTTPVMNSKQISISPHLFSLVSILYRTIVYGILFALCKFRESEGFMIKNLNNVIRITYRCFMLLFVVAIQCNYKPN